MFEASSSDLLASGSNEFSVILKQNSVNISDQKFFDNQNFGTRL